MAGRTLGPDEAALWARVRASVRPIAARGRPGPAAAPSRSDFEAAMNAPAAKPVRIAPVPFFPPAPTAAPPPAKAKGQHLDATLDAGWDRRLARGAVAPDSAIDLHGHTQASAHAMLDHGLAQAIARGDRVLLLVTGKPPRKESERPHARGAIRAAVGDWLASSRHAGAIAAVRGAHPRHGGAGALYLVLRRQRGK